MSSCCNKGRCSLRRTRRKSAMLAYGRSIRYKRLNSCSAEPPICTSRCRLILWAADGRCHYPPWLAPGPPELTCAHVRFPRPVVADSPTISSPASYGQGQPFMGRLHGAEPVCVRSITPACRLSDRNYSVYISCRVRTRLSRGPQMGGGCGTEFTKAVWRCIELSRVRGSPALHAALAKTGFGSSPRCRLY